MAEVRLFATLRKAAGEKSFQTDAATVGELMRELETRFGPGFKEKLREATVVVNGRNTVHIKGRKTRLAPDDVVSIFPPMAGG